MVPLGQHLRPHRQKSRGGEQLRPPRRSHPIFDEEITGQMGAEEGVERLVTVEGGDAPVAVAPGVAMGDVFVEPVGVGIADDVEPMPGLMLAVARRREQSIDHPIPGLRRLVRQEGVDLIGRRREARQCERCPSQERCLVGHGRRFDPLSVEPGDHKGVDWIGHVGGIMDGWKRCPERGRERPEGPLRDRVKRRLQRRRFDLSIGMVGPAIDPAADQLKSLVGELPVGRHGEGLVGIADRAGEDTFSRRPRHDHRPRLPARRKPGERIEPQAPLLLLGAVTRHAVGSEKRGNLLGKKLGAVARRHGRRPLGGRGPDPRQPGKPRKEKRHRRGAKSAPSTRGWETGRCQRTGPRSVRPRSLPTQKTDGADTLRIPPGSPLRRAGWRG